MPRRLGHRHLHAVANAEEGDVALAGVAGGDHLALRAARPEAGRDDDAGDIAEVRLRVVLLQFLGVDPVDLNGEVLRERRVLQRLRDGDVGVLQADVFADEGDARRSGRGCRFRATRPRHIVKSTGSAGSCSASTMYSPSPASSRTSGTS